MCLVKLALAEKKNEKQLLNGRRDDILYNLGEVRFTELVCAPMT